MKKRIHINQHVIRANAKNGTNDPAITVKTYRNNYYAPRLIKRAVGSMISSITFVLSLLVAGHPVTGG